jgi:pimeloyl-ACP methyl ester carboxylesterase
VRLLDRGLRPRAAILAGMGLAGIEDPAPRGQWFVRMIRGRGQWPRGSGEYLAERFMAASVPEPDALVPLLERQVATPAARLSTFELPILVVAGAEDRDNGSAADLARALPRAVFREIPGNHMGTVTRPELAGAMVEFLDGLDPS